MAKESFLLVSLKESKAKKLAQIISNSTSRRILDYLAEKGKATESEISKELSLPISTVHYNIKHLVDAKLVKADEFHYSEKGKEVNHYSLTNKYIIIAPESATSGIKDKLKSILPIGLITVVAAGVLQLLSKYYLSFVSFASKVAQTPVMEVMERDLAVEGAEAIISAPAAQILSTNATTGVAEAVAQTPVIQSLATNFVIWFLIGAMFVILLFLFVEWIKSKR